MTWEERRGNFILRVNEVCWELLQCRLVDWEPCAVPVRGGFNDGEDGKKEVRRAWLIECGLPDDFDFSSPPVNREDYLMMSVR